MCLTLPIHKFTSSDLLVVRMYIKPISQEHRRRVELLAIMRKHSEEKNIIITIWRR